MDDFVGHRTLIPPERLRELTRRSSTKGALQTASHFGAIALTGTGLYLAWGTVYAVPLFIVHGMLLNYLFAAQHEFNHYTVFERRWLNDLFNHVTAFLVLYPRSHERWFHYEHHRHTQEWDRDPELGGREPFTLGSYLLYLFGVSYWWRRGRTLLRQAAGIVPDGYLTPSQRRHVTVEARVHLAGHVLVAAVSIAFESWLAVQLWLAPVLLTKVLHQVQNITEHTGVSHEPNTLHNTRTIKTWPVLRWMAWNMQYHSAHHTYPAVPFHQLPALHAEIVKRLGYEPPTIGYLEFQRRFIGHLMKKPEPLEGFDEVRLPRSAAA